MDEKRKIKQLIRQLGSWDSNVMSKVVKQLVQIGKPAVPALIDALKYERNYRKNNIAKVLGLIGDSSATPALIDALFDKDRNGRCEATRALITPGVTSAFLAMLDTVDVLPAVTEALEKILNKCKAMKDVQDIEERLSEGLAVLKKKCHDKRILLNANFYYAKIKMKAAEKKYELAGKKGILLDDKPKPPKKGRVFQQLRRLRHG